MKKINLNRIYFILCCMLVFAPAVFSGLSHRFEIDEGANIILQALSSHETYELYPNDRSLQHILNFPVRFFGELKDLGASYSLLRTALNLWFTMVPVAIYVFSFFALVKMGRVDALPFVVLLYSFGVYPLLSQMSSLMVETVGLLILLFIGMIEPNSSVTRKRSLYSRTVAFFVGSLFVFGYEAYILCLPILSLNFAIIKKANLSKLQIAVGMLLILIGIKRLSGISSMATMPFSVRAFVESYPAILVLLSFTLISIYLCGYALKIKVFKKRSTFLVMTFFACICLAPEMYLILTDAGSSYLYPWRLKLPCLLVAFAILVIWTTKERFPKIEFPITRMKILSLIFLIMFSFLDVFSTFHWRKTLAQKEEQIKSVGPGCHIIDDVNFWILPESILAQKSFEIKTVIVSKAAIEHLFPTFQKISDLCGPSYKSLRYKPNAAEAYFSGDGFDFRKMAASSPSKF